MVYKMSKRVQNIALEYFIYIKDQKTKTVIRRECGQTLGRVRVRTNIGQQ